MVLLIVGGIAFAITGRKAALLGLHHHADDDAIISNSRAVFTGVALALTAALTIGFTGRSLWILPIVLYLIIWRSQVSQKIATRGQELIVSTMFATAMVASVGVQVFVLD